MMRRLLLVALVLTPFSASAATAPLSLNGVISDWDGERNLLALLEVDTPFGPYNLTSGSLVDANGRFQVTLDEDVTHFLLPAKEALRVAGAESTCRDEVRLTPPSARAQQFNVALHEAKTHLGRIEQLSSNVLPPRVGDVNARLVYADRAAKLTGQVVCPSGRVEKWNVNLDAGWNWVRSRATGLVGGLPNFDVSSAALPATIRWFRYGEVGALDLTFGEGNRVTRLGENARRAGVRLGDKIVKVGALYIDEVVVDASGILAPGAPGERVTLLVERQGTRLSIFVPRDRVRIPWM
ncbi:hypothetical protein [Deinococcus yavapaiensis]|nr:hypothetical protein [Deinococcus yavapaiensis]